MRIQQRSSSSAAVLFGGVPKGAPDPIQELNKRLAADPSSCKVDLGAGVYRNTKGQYHHLNVIHKAKQQLSKSDPGHDYNPTIGIPLFRKYAQSLVFGDIDAVRDQRIATIQTVAGTGANRIGAAFLSRFFYPSDGQKPAAYVGTPTWVNYKPLFNNAGFDVKTYDHLVPGTRRPNLVSIRDAMLNAPQRSTFVLQACCHNPTGVDYDQSQWEQLAGIMQDRRHFAFFDAAYLGFGSAATNALATDAWPIRYFSERGIDMLVCQSFSKNLGLYSERVGALHVVCANANIAENVLDQLRAQIRWEFSSSPAWGARLATIVMNDGNLSSEWAGEMSKAVARMEGNRRRLHQLLTQKFKTPGAWDHVVDSKGLFILFDLLPKQIEELISEYHVFLPPNGRINVAGLSDSNIEQVAEALDAVTRSYN